MNRIGRFLAKIFRASDSQPVYMNVIKCDAPKPGQPGWRSYARSFRRPAATA